MHHGATALRFADDLGDAGVQDDVLEGDAGDHREVRDDGRGSASTDDLGHGLVGVRERVKIYGGEMTAGSVAGGGFVLATRLPLGGDRL